MNYGGTNVEGRVGEDFISFCREVELKKILLYDADIRNMVFLEIGTEFLGGGMVWLDGPDFATFLTKGKSDDAGASTDVQDEVALFDIAMADEHEG